MSQFAIASFLCWRLWLFFLAGFGGRNFTFSPRFPYSDILLVSSKLPDWIWSFANFDGVHYLTIANLGYSAQYTQVFFPFYPLLIAFFSKLLPFLNPLIIALFLSNIIFLFMIIILQKLLELDYKKKSIRKMIIFLLVFPTSFFFGSVYTESLFLFLVISAFYAARKKQWILAGVLGALASATRLVGIFLLPALFWEWCINRFKDQKLNKILFSISHFRFSPIVYLVPLGLISYMLYLQFQFGDWLYFWHAQPVFGAERSGNSIVFLPQVLWRYAKILTSFPLTMEIFWIPFLELVFTLGAIICLIYAHIKKVRLSYLIFSWFAVIIPTLTGTLSSMPRYVLCAFPIFIILGLIENKFYKILLFFISLCILSVLTILFTRGHWVS